MYRTITAPNIVGNSTWTAIVPGQQLWRIVSVQVSVITNATAGNRFPVLTITNGNTTILSAPAAFTIPANSTVTVNWSSDLYAVANNTGTGVALAAITDALLPPGYTVTGSLFGGLPGDSIIDIVLWVDDLALGPESATATPIPGSGPGPGTGGAGVPIGSGSASGLYLFPQALNLEPPGSLGPLGPVGPAG